MPTGQKTFMSQKKCNDRSALPLLLILGLVGGVSVVVYQVSDNRGT